MPRTIRSLLSVVLAPALLASLAPVHLALARGAGPAANPLSVLKWRSVGPYVGGRVVAIAGVADDPNLFYMGAVDGGVWRSTDYGVKWVNLTDGKLPGSSDSIGAIAVARSNPKIIYVGTGESDIRNDMITGDGVFRSDDAGKTWKAAGLGDTHTISALAVDPDNPEIVYAASMGHVFKPNADRGVFKSTDGGATWHKILYVDAKTGAIDLVMDPSHPQVLYAAMWQAARTPWGLDDGGPGSGLYKSVDGGAHWSEISRNPGFARGTLGRIGVSVVASDPNVLYSIVQAKHGGVFRSTDGGATWTRVNRSWSLRQRAFYYMAIYADPDDPETVYVPNVDALWVSHDGGKSFFKLHTPHGDNHILWINPKNPKILLEGNDGGATVSTDGGSTWSSEHNQPTGQFYHIALDGQFPFHLYGAQQDELSYEGPSASSEGEIPLGDWHAVAYGESTFVAPEPGHPNITFGAGYYGILLRYDMKTGEFRDVSPWPDYRDGSASNEDKYRFGWTHPVFFSPTDPKALYDTSQYVMKSTDGGLTWHRISPDLTRNDPSTELPSGGPVDLDQTGAEVYPDISALGISPLDGKVIWAGSQDGLVHVTTDAGEHWRAVTPKDLPPWAEISSIEPSHVAAGTAYLSASRYMSDDFHPYVYETTDYGAHWTRIVSGIPAREYVMVVRQDPSDPSVLFAGTKNTVYVTLNGGERWQPLTLNLPHVQVRDIAIDAREGEVAIATHGRAFWILDHLPLIEEIAHHGNAGAGAAQLYAPQTAWLTFAYGVDPDAEHVPSVGTNPQFGAAVYFHIPADYHGNVPVTLSFLDDQGRVVRHFALHLRTPQPKLTPAERDNRTPHQEDEADQLKLTAIHPGYNRFQWDLRYPDATEVTGFYPPDAAGGLADTVAGPHVTPGRYTVVLDYNGQRTQVPLQVALDPRLHPAPGALDQQLALAMRIHAALDTLDRLVDQGIALRAQLRSAVAAGKAGSAQAHHAIRQLDTAIEALVQFDIHSSEGDCLHEPLLHGRLAYLGAQVELSYQQPTAAEYAVLGELNGEALLGEQKLKQAIAAGQQAL